MRRMEVAGSYSFQASPAAVWNLLINPGAIASCLPGCDRLEPAGEDRYQATLNVAVAAISGRYSGTVAILDKQPLNSYRLLVEGTGKTGSIKGEAIIQLGEESGGTTVTVKGQAQVVGILARVGQRLLASVSKMMMDRFFECLQGKLQSGNGISGS